MGTPYALPNAQPNNRAQTQAIKNGWNNTSRFFVCQMILGPRSLQIGPAP